MSTAITYGYRGGAASVAGLQTGPAIHIVRVGTGVGTRLSRSLLAFNILKWVGAACLVRLGIQQWRTARALDLNVLAREQLQGGLIIARCWLISPIPKVSCFLRRGFYNLLSCTSPW